jgi:hypothetical protein
MMALQKRNYKKQHPFKKKTEYDGPEEPPNSHNN